MRDAHLQASTDNDALKSRGDRTRVLFISSDSSSTTGVGRSFVDLMCHLDTSRIEPHVVVPWPGPGEVNIVDELRAAGMEPNIRHLGYWIPPRETWGARHLLRWIGNLKTRMWSIASLIERHSIDIVYTSTMPCIDGALAARMTKRPHVWHVQEVIKGHPGFRAYLPWPVLRHMTRRLSDRIIVPSRYLHDLLASGADHDKIRIVYNGIDTRSFVHDTVDKKGILKSLGVSDSSRLVAIIGTIEKVKAQEIVVRAAARIKNEISNTIFVFVGTEESRYAERVRHLIREFGLEENFRFLGPRLDVYNILAVSQCLVLTSRFETFGRVLVEAMAAGLPVVATKCGGPGEIVVDGETGFLVAIDDDLALSQKLLDILLDPVLASRLGTTGRQRAVEVFSIERHVVSMQNELLSVLRTAVSANLQHPPGKIGQH